MSPEEEGTTRRQAGGGGVYIEPLMGQSPSMLRLFELIEKVSDTSSTLFIEGESGTGKEVVAKTIHYSSSRRNKPFIPINCGAIPESLLESELFGHEKGAFTGASSSRPGRFELAHEGTIFLDEIGEMPYPLQVKLLRVLQEREFERIGGTKSIQVDVRVIAASNQDMEQAVSEKRFRNDLYFRLNVIPIHLSPLRERKQDIPIFIDYFIQKFNKKNNTNVKGFSEEAENILQDYHWPGNIRELENLIERLVTLNTEAVITASDLPDKLKKPIASALMSDFQFPEEGIRFSELVMEFEHQLIQHALLKSNGVKNKAARLLNLKRTTLVEKLKRRKPLAEVTGQEDPTEKVERIDV